MAASAEAPLEDLGEDAALEAVAVFLRGSGYAGAAASLDAARRDRAAGAQGAGGGDAFAERLQALAASLGRLSAEGGRGAAQESEATLPLALPGGRADRRSPPPGAPRRARRTAARACGCRPRRSRRTTWPGGLGASGTPGTTSTRRIPDLYRDDADPGYRMREVLESELTAALRDDAQPAGFRPAFGGTAAFGCDGVSDPGLPRVRQRRLRDRLLRRRRGGACGAGGAALRRRRRADGRHRGGAGVPAGRGGRRHRRPGEECGHEPVLIAGDGQGTERGRGGGPGAQGAEGGVVAATPPRRPLVRLPAAGGRRAGGSSEGPEKAGTRSNFLQPDSGDPFYPAEMDGIVYDSFPLRVVFDRDKTGFEDTKEFPVKANGIIAARYQVQEVVGAAVFSRAVQCLDLHTNRMVCMKVISRNDKEYVDQSLDEIKLLRFIGANAENLDEKCCLQLLDCFYHKEHLIIVTELLRENLYEFSRFNRESGEEPFFTLGRVQRIAKQILTALEYTHSLCLIHADLKPENVLVKSYSRCEVKLIDFGSSCFVDDHLPGYVQSRAYRAPEVVLGCPYDQKIDMWSLACIIAELWTGKVLFHADCAQGVLARILGIIGPIPEHMMASGRFVPELFTFDGQLYSEVPETAPAAAGFGVSEPRVVHLYEPKASSLRQRMRTRDDEFLDFLTKVLTIDPAGRPTAAEALQHPWLSPGRYRDGIPA
ncbi:unnamed protein product [Prorocentrum cordatum]|uniref:Protein kinase domain-containing protein n=1 Tax=Prorocentrum cordatum TaxID=2364126 RepID=A0ABN9QUU0_9DINO|nr:unnamed protein product [Polarella glacialis]